MSNQPLERDQDTIQAMPDHELAKWREHARIETEIHPEDSELLRLFAWSTHEVDQRMAERERGVSGWLV